jgi:hypothetical protein
MCVETSGFIEDRRPRVHPGNLQKLQQKPGCDRKRYSTISNTRIMEVMTLPVPSQARPSLFGSD